MRSLTHIIYIICFISEGGSRKGRQKDYTPGQWSEYFAEKKDIQIDDNHVFRVYLSKPSTEKLSPVLLLLHGGGYSALTWSHFTVILLVVISIISVINSISYCLHNGCIFLRLKLHRYCTVNALQSIYEVTETAKLKMKQICRLKPWLGITLNKQMKIRP